MLIFCSVRRRRYVKAKKSGNDKLGFHFHHRANLFLHKLQPNCAASELVHDTNTLEFPDNLPKLEGVPQVRLTDEDGTSIRQNPVCANNWANQEKNIRPSRYVSSLGSHVLGQWIDSL